MKEKGSNKQIDSRSTCWYCGQPATQMDHINPVFLGGNNSPTNLVPVCSWCNKSKRHYPIEEWRKKLALKYGYSFSEIQRNFWISRGITLPPDAKFIFYFEKMGWVIS